jgi:hypothetical protein
MDAFKKFLENNKTLSVAIGALAAAGSIAVYIISSKGTPFVQYSRKAKSHGQSTHPSPMCPCLNVSEASSQLIHFLTSTLTK